MLNPAGDRKVERFGWTFASGDKVMQIENDYGKEVYNGDIGYIDDVDPNGMFTPDEIAAHLAQIERAQTEKDVEVVDEDDPFRESPAAAMERGRQFALIKELLIATTLGTS